MIKLTVINMRVLIKNMFKLTCICLLVIFFLEFIKISYKCVKKISWDSAFSSKNNIQLIKNNILVSKSFSKEEKKNVLKNLLVSELAIFTGAEEEKMEKENQEEIIKFSDNISNNEELVVESDVENVVNKNENEEKNVEKQTKIISENNKKDVYTDFYKNVRIKNESNYKLTEQMVTPNIQLNNKKDFIVYHTHTSESYTPTEKNSYIATGNYRTTDNNNSVVKVGEELANNLAGKGYTIIHDKTCHDYPAYTGSYSRSLSTIKNLLLTYNTVEMVFDIHRDALRK